MAAMAFDWAREFDANSLLTLWRAVATYNTEPAFGRIRAKLLYILADTDAWFPSSLGRDVMAKLLSTGADARFLEISSRHGHYATTEEPEKWVPAARSFLAELASIRTTSTTSAQS